MVAADGDHYRRVVPSPRPQSILQIEQIKAMLGASDSLVVCCGGGGVPMVRTAEGRLEGVEAVIDKDLCSSLLAQQVRHPPPPQPPTALPPQPSRWVVWVQLGADGLIILTDGGGIWENFGKPEAREMSRATPSYLSETGAGQKFPGSMGPKVTACVEVGPTLPRL